MKKFFSCMVLITLVISMSLFNVEEVSAESISELNDKINEMNKQQDKLKGNQKDLESSQKQTDKKMEKNVSEQTKVKQDIQAIDEKLAATYASIEAKEVEINATDQQIKKIDEEISKLDKEIKELKERIKKRELLLKDRLITIQKSGGGIKYIEVIFGSQSFGDFISRAFAVNTIMDQDKTIMEEHEADQISLEKKQAQVKENKLEVEKQKVALESQKQELLTLKSQLDKQVDEKKVLIAQLEEEHEELEEYKLSVKEEEIVLAEQNAAIKKAKQVALDQKSNLEQLAKEKKAKEEAAKAKAAKEQEEANKPSTGGNQTVVNKGNGMFTWPTPTSHRITSGFNPSRLHPILGTIRPHNGMDIGAPNGEPVVAAGSGVVASAGVLGGYGNMVMITHIIKGQPYTTLYAHLSTISVSVGQVVNAGDKIGEVGNTGNSTAPHLHFEIHPEGYNNPVNPQNYF